MQEIGSTANRRGWLVNQGTVRQTKRPLTAGSHYHSSAGETQTGVGFLEHRAEWAPCGPASPELEPWKEMQRFQRCLLRWEGC